MDGPLFVKIDDYNNVNGFIAQVDKKLAESKKLLEEIDSLKREEESLLEKWRQGVQELEKKTNSIKGMLYNVKY